MFVCLFVWYVGWSFVCLFLWLVGSFVRLLVVCLFICLVGLFIYLFIYLFLFLFVYFVCLFLLCYMFCYVLFVFVLFCCRHCLLVFKCIYLLIKRIRNCSQTGVDLDRQRISCVWVPLDDARVFLHLHKHEFSLRRITRHPKHVFTSQSC